MLSKFQRSRGFIFTMDALFSALIVISLSGMLAATHDPQPDLNGLLLYQQAQDIMEVCSKRFDLSPRCFDFLNETNPALGYCLDCDASGAVEIARSYPDKEITLSVWMRSGGTPFRR